MQGRIRRPVLVWAILLILTVGSIAWPSDAAAQPIPRVGARSWLVDMSAECGQNTLFQDATSAPGEQPPPPLGGQPTIEEPSLIAPDPFKTALPNSGNFVLTSSWQLPLESQLTLNGLSSWVRVNAGALIIVSCDSDLIFDEVPNDGALSRVPAGIGIYLDSSNPTGIAIDGGPVLIYNNGNAGVASALIDVESAELGPEVCTLFSCLNGAEMEVSVEGGGPCAGLRCWSR